MSSLVLLSNDPSDTPFAQKVAEVAGLELHTLVDPAAAAKVQAEEEQPVFFINCPDEASYKAFEAAMSEEVGLFSDRIQPNRMHFLSRQDLQEVQYFMQSSMFGNYVSKDYGDIQSSGQRYGYLVKAQQEERCFGLEQLISPEAKIQTIQFKSTSQKQQGVEAVKNYLLSAKFKTRMATVIANAVDELIMNAMFDAAIDEVGRQIYVSTPRDQEIELSGKQAVEMSVGYDKQYVAISAVDLFGSLDKEKLINHISKRYREEEYKVKASVAGAGIGLATVFRSGGSFLFSSEKGERTEVTVFFKRTDNFRAFKEQFRFISTQFYY